MWIKNLEGPQQIPPPHRIHFDGGEVKEVPDELGEQLIRLSTYEKARTPAKPKERKGGGK
jgi:hypothetical protein